MKLSRAVEQACCIVVLLAHPELRTPVTNNSLAERMKVSPTYITKITRKLVEKGLISSVRGTGGGFRLVRDRDEITLWDMVVAIEGEGNFVEYQGVAERMFPSEDSDEIDRGAGIIVRAFDRAYQNWARELKEVTLKDIMKEIQHG